MFSPRRWVWNVLVGIDQLGNALIGGYSDETISARAGRYTGKLWYWTWLAKVLNWIDPGHTNHAMDAEQKQTQQAPTYRKDDP